MLYIIFRDDLKYMRGCVKSFYRMDLNMTDFVTHREP